MLVCFTNLTLIITFAVSLTPTMNDHPDEKWGNRRAHSNPYYTEPSAYIQSPTTFQPQNIPIYVMPQQNSYQGNAGSQYDGFMYPGYYAYRRPPLPYTPMPSKKLGCQHSHQPEPGAQKDSTTNIRSGKKQYRMTGRQRIRKTARIFVEKPVHSDLEIDALTAASNPRIKKHQSFRNSAHGAVYKQQKCMTCIQNSFQCDGSLTNCLQCLRQRVICMPTASSPQYSRSSRGPHPLQNVKTAIEEETPNLNAVDGAQMSRLSTEDPTHPEEDIVHKVGDQHHNFPGGKEDLDVGTTSTCGQVSAKNSPHTEHGVVGKTRNQNDNTAKEQREHTRDQKKTSLAGQIVASAKKLGLKTPLDQRQLGDPNAALYLLRDHKDFIMDYYKAVFMSLSDIESSELLNKWILALCDGFYPQSAPFWWPSDFDYDKIDDQDPMARKEILQHVACGYYDEHQKNVLRRLRRRLGEEWGSVDSILCLRMVEPFCHSERILNQQP